MTTFGKHDVANILARRTSDRATDRVVLDIVTLHRGADMSVGERWSVAWSEIVLLTDMTSTEAEVKTRAWHADRDNHKIKIQILKNIFGI